MTIRGKNSNAILLTKVRQYEESRFDFGTSPAREAFFVNVKISGKLSLLNWLALFDGRVLIGLVEIFAIFCKRGMIEGQMTPTQAA